ncbi:unnamed protein product [Medioppia subpectinata]|uniref:GPR158/179 extracellular domain-containing protein n=1 Tax=Medioppia subpectinata TaxID=1979941 RepID=A0A7R9PZI2_9ACAR|nr:unnamed protein product [Medioppia subpectinata]CAG2107016.1 unnamed protein product [Medioppia subpectinata]
MIVFVCRGVVLVSVDLAKTDINQCAGDNSFFSDTHKCHIHSQCHPIEGMGFRRGAYICRCKAGYYFPNKNKSSLTESSLNDNYFRGIAVEEAMVEALVGSTKVENSAALSYVCVPCAAGCTSCSDNEPCYVQYNIFIRVVTLGVQSFCATITLIIAIAICKLRRSKNPRNH